MLVYLCMMLVLSCLCLLACVPLIRIASIHVQMLWTIGHSVPGTAYTFLSSKWSWLLGPIGRPIVGLILGTHPLLIQPRMLSN